MSETEHKVVVMPAGIEIQARHGETLLAAANRNGFYWPTACGGEAVCTRCFIEVDDDSSASFTEMKQREREGLQSIRWAAGERPGERLACQAQVVGDASVSKKFVRKARETDLLPFADGVPSVDGLAVTGKTGA